MVVEDEEIDCNALQEAVATAVAEGAACSTDQDCAIRFVGRCAMPGLDCHSVHYNPALPTVAADGAIGRYGRTCKHARCRCAEPEVTACVEGRCQRPE